MLPDKTSARTTPFHGLGSIIRETSDSNSIPKSGVVEFGAVEASAMPRPDDDQVALDASEHTQLSNLNQGLEQEYAQLPRTLQRLAYTISGGGTVLVNSARPPPTTAPHSITTLTLGEYHISASSANRTILSRPSQSFPPTISVGQDASSGSLSTCSRMDPTLQVHYDPTPTGHTAVPSILSPATQILHQAPPENQMPQLESLHISHLPDLGEYSFRASVECGSPHGGGTSGASHMQRARGKYTTGANLSTSSSGIQYRNARTTALIQPPPPFARHSGYIHGGNTKVWATVGSMEGRALGGPLGPSLSPLNFRGSIGLIRGIGALNLADEEGKPLQTNDAQKLRILVTAATWAIWKARNAKSIGNQQTSRSLASQTLTEMLKDLTKKICGRIANRGDKISSKQRRALKLWTEISAALEDFSDSSALLPSYSASAFPDPEIGTISNVGYIGLARGTTPLDNMPIRAPYVSANQAMRQSTQTDAYENILQPQGPFLVQNIPPSSSTTTINHGRGHGSLSFSMGWLPSSATGPFALPLRMGPGTDILPHTSWEESQFDLQQQLNSSNESRHSSNLLGSEMWQPYIPTDDFRFPAVTNPRLNPSLAIEVPRKTCAHENIVQPKPSFSLQDVPLRSFATNMNCDGSHGGSPFLSGYMPVPEISGLRPSDISLGTDPAPDTLPRTSCEKSHFDLQQQLELPKGNWHSNSPLNSKIWEPHSLTDDLPLSVSLDALLHPSLGIQAPEHGYTQATSNYCLCGNLSDCRADESYTGEFRAHKSHEAPCTCVISRTSLSPMCQYFAAGEPSREPPTASNCTENTPPFSVDVVGSNVGASCSTRYSSRDESSISAPPETTSRAGLVLKNAARTRHSKPSLFVMWRVQDDTRQGNHLHQVSSWPQAIRLWRLIVQLSFLPKKVSPPPTSDEEVRMRLSRLALPFSCSQAMPQFEVNWIAIGNRCTRISHSQGIITQAMGAEKRKKNERKMKTDRFERFDN
ncbi:hypothetical protein M408DRAFT_305135 [Serendipita vermifera MAFF 305830]|uniref:Uncharacterized protein n=1 Tax=Serendipita vermifera MAFF 305830 TaxID=933852 RepID=A0A0C2W3V3_SERVB|nr:hypothetical protein M408DRAFT_305135 [Serendipita vermifera MAFF 305830]